MTRAKCPKSGKQSHTSKAGAIRHIEALKRIGAVRLQAYRCTACKGWHVGHYSKGRR